VEHGWPTYSADGKWIYFSSMEKGTYSIYRIKPDGTGLQQLTHAKVGEDDARVNVSHDGKFMIYNKKADDTIMICYMELP
jgi:Tol biopolymer transport system component